MTYEPPGNITHGFQDERSAGKVVEVDIPEYNGTPDKILDDAIAFYDKRLDQLGEEIDSVNRKLNLKKKEWETVRGLLEQFYKAKEILKDAEGYDERRN